MSVTNYTLEKCKYNHSKLKNVLYLVSEEHVKDVHIDNGEAYISGLTELPLRINGFNIQYTEETSLDERYKFNKKLTLSMKGYVNYKLFGGRYYAIIEDNDGIYYMLNVDFPSKITHTFNLSQNSNQTDFTFSSLSNFPTIKLNSEFEAEDLPCLGYNVYGIDELKLINKDYVRIDTHNKKVITTLDDWKTIEFLGKSCSLQEVYDGEKVTDTITFQIPLNQKIGWAWNLLEFLDNLYASTITPKGGDNIYYSGFNFGLEPSYSIQTSSNNGESDIITITLVETSNYGSTAAVDFSDEDYDITHWRYVKWVGDIKCYECVGYARARYLVQQEVDAFGNPTGNYKVKEGYSDQYQMLNVVDTFSSDTQFNDVECAGDSCELETTIPDLIIFSAATCNAYSLSSSCDWNVSNLESYLTASPSSGVADSAYTVTICNTSSNISGQSSTFNINYGSSVKLVNVILTEGGFIYPTTVDITCIQQDVTFTFDSNCPVTVISNPSNLVYQITNSSIIVTVPKNESETSAITYNLTVKDCNDNTQILTINQDKLYVKWVASGYMCESGNSYNREVKYTGTSNSSYYITQEYRKGSLILSGDTRCSGQTKWEFDGNYYCIDGNKYQCIEEFEISGSTWVKTWQTRLGDMVESASTFCDESLYPVSYEWRLNQRKWQCDGKTYRWVTMTGANDYWCSGTTKMNMEKEQYSPNGVSGWTDTGNIRSGTTVLQYNSTDCGYEPQTGYTNQYLTFVATESGTFKLSGNSVSYSLDSGSTWNTLASGTDSPTVSAGNKIMWKGNLIPTSSGIGVFSSSGRFYVEGNIMSLLYEDNFSTQTSLISKSYAFANLFVECIGLISAQNLVLPATTLSESCYDSMFLGCTSLTTAPELPATNLTYGYYCYAVMFARCSSLTTAPVLPATTLVDGCYFQMFAGCSSLNYVKCLAVGDGSSFANDETYNWLSGVSSSGTFVKNNSMSTWTIGVNGIPTNWTVQNATS